MVRRPDQVGSEALAVVLRRCRVRPAEPEQPPRPVVRAGPVHPRRCGAFTVRVEHTADEPGKLVRQLPAGLVELGECREQWAVISSRGACRSSRQRARSDQGEARCCPRRCANSSADGSGGSTVSASRGSHTSPPVSNSTRTPARPGVSTTSTTRPVASTRTRSPRRAGRGSSGVLTGDDSAPSRAARCRATRRRAPGFVAP